MPEEKQKWIVTHDSHKLKKGEIYEGTELPAWLAGKANPLSAGAFVVSTPDGADLEKLKADLAAQTQRADEAEAKLVTSAEALTVETKRADEAVAALEAANKKAK